MKGADRNSQEEYTVIDSLNTYNSLEYSSASKSEHSRFSSFFGKFIPDPYLNEYLENLKQRIAKEESAAGDGNWVCIHPRLVGERARIIAEFVADEMSGPEPDPVCSGHYKEMHINEMKSHLGTNILPLGFIRMGDYLERAMLFKVLADRIGFPCALVRGQHGRAWIEIAIPVVNVEDAGDPSLKKSRASLATYSELKMSSKETFRTSESLGEGAGETNEAESLAEEEGFWYPKIKMNCFKALPNFLLKPNAIVDLVTQPGRIIKINSAEAEEYCGTLYLGQC